MNNPVKIALLGCGSMNEAILSGLLGGGTRPDDVTVTVRRKERAEELAGRYGVAALATAEHPDGNVRAATTADVVILGVKPAGTVSLCREIAPALPAEAVVLSIAAAVSLALLETALPAGQPVIRTMPNTPARVGRGVVSVSLGTSCDPGHRDLAHRVLSPLGTVVDLPESRVDALTAISGSGPAYVFFLAEAMAAAGAELGLDPALAALLARETIAGAGQLLGEPGADARALREAVTSPNGTTERAIAAFRELGLADVVAAGARAAAARSAEITAELAGRP